MNLLNLQSAISGGETESGDDWQILATGSEGWRGWRTGRAMGESAYSYSLTTFSPSGKLVQIEYALSAVTKAP